MFLLCWQNRNKQRQWVIHFLGCQLPPCHLRYYSYTWRWDVSLQLPGSFPRGGPQFSIFSGNLWKKRKNQIARDIPLGAYWLQAKTVWVNLFPFPHPRLKVKIVYIYMKMNVCFPFLPVLRQLDKTPWGPANQQDSQFGGATCTVIVVFASLAGSDSETAGLWVVNLPSFLKSYHYRAGWDKVHS